MISEFVAGLPIGILMVGIIRYWQIGRTDVITSIVCAICFAYCFVLPHSWLSVSYLGVDVILISMWAWCVSRPSIPDAVIQNLKHSVVILRDIQRDIIKKQIFINGGDLDAVANALDMTREELSQKMEELHLLNLDEDGNIY